MRHTCNQNRLPGGQSSWNEGGLHVDSERERTIAWKNWAGQNGESKLWKVS